MILSDNILGRNPGSWLKFLAGVILVPVIFLVIVVSIGAMLTALYIHELISFDSPLLNFVDELDGSPASIAASFIMIGLVHLVLWPFLWIAYRRKYLTLVNPLGKPWKSDVTLGLIYILVLLIGTEIFFLPFGYDASQIRYIWQPSIWLMWFLPMAVIVFVQISAEELFFRGFIQQYLARLVPKRWVYITIPSVVWAMLHYGNIEGRFSSIMIVVVIGAMGIVFADWADITGSLWGPLTVHFGNNFFLIMVYGNTMEPSDLNIIQYNMDAYSDAKIGSYMMIGTVMTLLIYLPVRKRIMARAGAPL